MSNNKTSTLWQQDLKPEPSIEERYDVSTGVRRRGPYKLDTTNLVAGSFLPSFTPIAATYSGAYPFTFLQLIRA